MIKNVRDFAEVVAKHHNELNSIPEEYLNDDGKAMKQLYSNLFFALDFAATCSDMLRFIREDEEFVEIHNPEAIRELRLIERCLEKVENC